MKINNKEYFTNFGEFYTTSYPGYENLIIKPEVGILERHIGLLKDINDDLFALSSLCVIGGDFYGGFVPINCADNFSNVFVYSTNINTDIQATFETYKNIHYSTTFYPCKFIYIHNLELVNEEILKEIRLMRDENSKQHTSVSERIIKLEKWIWVVSGGGFVVGFLLSQIGAIASLFH